MSSLWLYLTLLYAASFVQNSASSGSGVTLKCNETVEVEAGEMVTLNCTITYSGLDKPQDCKCLSYSWNNIDIIPCRQDNGLDSVTYVSLTLSNVTKNGTYTATIKTDCGRATSSPIEVQVIQLGDGDRMEHSNNTHDGETMSTHVPAKARSRHVPAKARSRHVLAIFYGIFIIVMLYFLFRTNRGREIMERIKKKQTHEAHSDMDTALGSPLIA